MIRILFGSALPVLGLGVAAAFLGPELSGPRGEPMIMAVPNEASLQAATFDGEACPSTLLFAGSSADSNTVGRAETRIVAFALRSIDNDVAVAIENFPAGNDKAKTIVLVFNNEGDLLAAGDPATLQVPFDDEITQDCPSDIAAPI